MVVSIGNKQSEIKNDVLLHMQAIIRSYLQENPKVSLNALSKRCAVSEPTLRRITKGQIKTVPTVTTIIDILSFIGKENKISKLMELFPGPAADYISEHGLQFEEIEDIEYSDQLTQSLQDPVKYLIYKLSANESGVSEAKAQELFGRYGITQIEELLEERLLIKKGDSYHARIDTFCLSDDVFVKHFKAVADFIKPHKHASASKAYSPLYANYSASISKEAYSAVLRIQRVALKKVIKILTDKQSRGSIPTFVLGAVDTIDNRCADEFPES